VNTTKLLSTNAVREAFSYLENDATYGPFSVAEWGDGVDLPFTTRQEAINLVNKGAEILSEAGKRTLRMIYGRFPI